MALKPAVFLDRDGVINRSIVRNGRAYPPADLQAFEFLPGAIGAIDRLKKAGFYIIVVTNQPDVRTGVQKECVVNSFHQKIQTVCSVDDIFVCYHIDDDHCDCRKPKPGMLLRAAQKWSLCLARSFMVGDRWRDIEAGKNAGCTSIWVKSQYDERKPQDPDCVVDSLFDASLWILNQAKMNS